MQDRLRQARLVCEAMWRRRNACQLLLPAIDQARSVCPFRNDDRSKSGEGSVATDSWVTFVRSASEPVLEPKSSASAPDSLRRFGASAPGPKR